MLLGDRVVVVARTGTWAKVVVPDQPSPADRRGYPGWVPLVQLTAAAPTPASHTATVVARTAWLRSDDDRAVGVMEVSFGTRLPLRAQTGGVLRVILPAGRVLRLAASDASVTATGAAALEGTGTMSCGPP